MAWLFIKLQQSLPKKLITKIIFFLARIKVKVIKDFLIKNFISIYSINTDEVLKKIPDDFITFNDFFVRELKPNSRIIISGEDNICSPADGKLTMFGKINNDTILQAKNKTYSIEDLLQENKTVTESFYDGIFATIYLAPYNYHRVHSPLEGEIIRITHIPGTLFSVNEVTTNNIPKVLARNERVVCYIRARDKQAAIVFVGALNVGSISTPWTGLIKPIGRGAARDLILHKSVNKQVNKGDLLGWFNMGSTVVSVFPKGLISLKENIKKDQKIHMGDFLGSINEEISPNAK